VVAEGSQSERNALDAPDEVVGRLGGAVAQVHPVPCGDLFLPTDDGPTEGRHLDRAGLVLEVLAEALDEGEGEGEGEGEVGIVVLVDAAHDLLSVNRLFGNEPLWPSSHRRRMKC
jgi:hypothetical protein